MTQVSFVTGGTGFIGATLTKRLINEGHEVRVLARNPEKAKSLFGDRVTIVTGDLLDGAALHKGLKGVDYVFHLAAAVGDYGPKKEFFRVNRDGTLALVDAAAAAGVARFIYMSSNAVIGMKREKITTEETPYSNTGGYYGISKGIAERAILKRHREEGFPGVILRPPAVYGPGSPNWVLRIVELMKEGRMPLIGNGRGICWLIYIDNLIDATMLTLTNDHALGEIFIVTDDRSLPPGALTWKTYFNTLAETAGFPPVKKNIPESLAKVLARIMYALYVVFGKKPLLTPMGVGIMTTQTGISCEKAKEVLGYSPRIDLKEGMRRVVEQLRAEGVIET